MLLSRAGAFVLTFTFILLLSLGGIALMLGIGTTITHGRTVEHSAGVVVQMGEDEDLVLLTASGEREQFRCVQRCLIERGHIVRHIREHAHTDVYYIEMPDKKLVATDVD
ncbi:MAG: hypothetical protein H0U76_00975 [Ktedonobacteraceae bacterium]|nr:hypothetical protein [Ktedonobacteraceae bacterium]